MGMHDGQLAVSPGMVRELVDEQFPQWRGLAITAVESPGTVNAIFRVGGLLAARFPLRPGDVGVVRRRLAAEAAAACELAGRTRFATPEPVALGQPGAGYPLPWAVQTWLPGVTAADDDPGASGGFAHDLAEFIGGVRTIGTGGLRFSGQGGEVTCASMTRGCAPASPAASSSWMSRGCARCGGACGSCRAVRAAM